MHLDRAGPRVFPYERCQKGVAQTPTGIYARKAGRAELNGPAQRTEDVLIVFGGTGRCGSPAHFGSPGATKRRAGSSGEAPEVVRNDAFLRHFVAFYRGQPGPPLKINEKSMEIQIFRLFSRLSKEGQAMASL